MISDLDKGSPAPDGLEASIYGRLSELHDVVFNGRALVELWQKSPGDGFAGLVLKSAADARDAERLAEIARLRAEVEGLTEKLDEWTARAEGLAPSEISAGQNRLATRVRELEAENARLREALGGVLDAETVSVHVGYDSWSGGGNYVYAEAVRTDSDSFRIARAALTGKADGESEV